MSEKIKHTPGPWHWEQLGDRHLPIALVSERADVVVATGDDDNSWLDVSADLAGARAPEENPEAILRYISDAYVMLRGVPDDVIGRLDEKTRTSIVKGFEEQIARFKVSAGDPSG